VPEGVCEEEVVATLYLFHVLHYYLPKLGPTDRASVRVIERKRVTWSRKVLGSKAPDSFHTTDQKVRGSNPFGRTSNYNCKMEKLRQYSPQILATTWLAVFSLGMYFPNFAKILGFAKGPKPFMDLQQVLTAGDCQDESTANLLAGVCDPWNRPIPYPSWILEVVQFLDASNSYVLTIGWINALLLALVIYFLGTKCRDHIIWFALAVLSPPMFFLAERGNIDSLILFLTIFFVIGESQGKKIWHLWIPGLLTALKIFPFGLFLALNKKQNLFISLVIGIVLLPIWVGDLSTILGNQPHSRVWSYGNIILLTQDMNKLYSIGAIDFKVTLFLALITLLVWLSAYGLGMLLFKGKVEKFVSELEENDYAKALFLSGSFVFLITFVTISVGDYKLWTALLTIAALLTMPKKSDTTLRKTLGFLLIFGMWCSRYTPTFIQVLGDISLYLAATMLFVINLNYLITCLKKLKPAGRRIDS